MAIEQRWSEASPGEPDLYEVIIIGAGPAGIAAACAAQDAGLTYLVIERNGIVQSLVEHPQQLRYFSPADELAVGGIPFPMAGGHKPTREDALAYYRAVASERRLALALWEEAFSAEPSNVAEVAGLHQPGLEWDAAIDMSPEIIFAAADDVPLLEDSYTVPTHIELPDGIDGADDDSNEQTIAPFAGLEDIPAEVIQGPVLGFRVTSQKWNTGVQVERYCRFLIVCSGTFQNPRRLEVPGAHLPKVHYKLDDPTPYFGCDVLVVGGGNSAATAAMTLADAGARVTLAMRREPVDFQSHLRPFIVRDLKLMAEDRRLGLVTGMRLVSVAPDRVTLVAAPYGTEPDIAAREVVLANDFVFAMIGHTADPRLFNTLGLPLADDGLPVFDDATAESPIPGIFIAGSLSRANIIVESRRRAVEIVERIKAEIVACRTA